MKELTMEERFAALESVKIKGMKHEGKYLYLKCETMVDKCIVIGADQLLSFIQEEITHAESKVVRDILEMPTGCNLMDLESGKTEALYKHQIEAYAKQNNL